jgi:hypothetical protein
MRHASVKSTSMPSAAIVVTKAQQASILRGADGFKILLLGNWTILGNSSTSRDFRITGVGWKIDKEIGTLFGHCFEYRPYLVAITQTFHLT